MRGALTEKIQKIAKKHLKRKITIRELRLLPYIQFVMMNEQRLDIARINGEERKILALWKKEDLIEGGAGGLSICKDFWNFMNEVLWEGYVVGGSLK